MVRSKLKPEKAKAATPAPGRNGRGRVDDATKRVYHQTVVDERPAHCPNCGSARGSTIRTERISISVVQRHKHCLNCPMGYKTLEELHRSDWKDAPDSE